MVLTCFNHLMKCRSKTVTQFLFIPKGIKNFDPKPKRMRNAMPARLKRGGLTAANPHMRLRAR